MTLVSQYPNPVPSQEGLSRYIEDHLRSHYEDIRRVSLNEGGQLANITEFSSAGTPTLDDDILWCWGDTTITLPYGASTARKVYHIVDVSTNQITVDSTVNVNDVTRQNLATGGAMMIAGNGSEWRILASI